MGVYCNLIVSSLLNGGRKHPHQSDAAQMMGTSLEDILAVPQQAECWQWLCHRGVGNRGGPARIEGGG